MIRMRWAICVLCMSLTSMAQAGDWEVYTNVQNVRQLLVDSSFVYAVTSGGLYRQEDQGTGYRIFNSGDGLGSHDLRAGAIEGDTIWVGGKDAILTRFDLRFGDARVYPLSLGMTQINALLNMGDTLWVGSDIGLGLFLKVEADGILKEVYTQFGSFPAEASVFGIELYQARLWLITPFGLVSARSNDAALHIASRWTSYPDPDGALLTAHRLEIWRDSLYVGTDSGLYVLKDSIFVPRYSDRQVLGLFADSDSLWLATDSGAYLYFGDSAMHHQALNFRDVPILDIARVPGGELWISRGATSLFHFGPSGPWFFEAVLNQPHGPSFSGVAVLNGAIWTAFRDKGGGFLARGGSWAVTPGIFDSPGAPTDAVRSALNSVFFPGHGQGLYVFTPSGDSLITVHYDATNSVLAPVAPTLHYTVVRDVAIDAAGGIWANNGTTDNDQSLVYISPGGASQVTFGPTEGIVNTDVSVLLLEGTRIWIGYNSGGLGVLDFNNTPLEKADDRYYVFTSEQDGLPANAITALVLSFDQKIWIGTPGGLARWDPEFFPFPAIEFADLRPADAEVTSLLSDRANRIWVGTGSGLARLPAGGLVAESTWFAGSSSLPDNRVLSLANDAQRPAIWVGTENGLATRPVLARVPVGSPKVFPNPFHKRVPGDVVTFDVGAGSRVDIYTLARDRVRTLTSSLIWDGTNDDGVPVASGLYLFRVTYEDGTTGRGRIGLIVE